jgi:hypothetical protein
VEDEYKIFIDQGVITHFKRKWLGYREGITWWKHYVKGKIRGFVKEDETKYQTR